MEFTFEDLHQIEQLLNTYLIPDLTRIVLRYFGLSDTYNRIIDQYIESYHTLIHQVSHDIEIDLQLYDFCEVELDRRWYHLDYIDTSYLIKFEFDCYPLFDIPINIKFEHYLWEILDLSESDYFVE